MKYFLTLSFLLIAVNVNSQNKIIITLPDASPVTVLANQQIQLAQSSFSPMYLFVFELQEKEQLQFFNLTDEFKDTIFRIDSFELIKELGSEKWIAYLKKDGDKKIYACEIEDALKTKEIILLE